MQGKFLKGFLLFGLLNFSVHAEILSLSPNSYTTTSGTDNAQPVANIKVMNAKGMDDAPTALKFFSSEGNYAGYRSYFLPLNFDATTISKITVTANIKITNSKNKFWNWQIYDWSANNWVPLGNTSILPLTGPWNVVNFSISYPFKNYINAKTGEIKIQTLSENQMAAINYEALKITFDPNSHWSGQQFYVSSTGKDSNLGTKEDPWATIQHAATIATAGSIVYVKEGTYRERIVFLNSGSSEKGPITFMSYPGEKATIDGTNVTMPSNQTLAPNGLLHIEDKNYLIIQNFEIQNLNTAKQDVFPAMISISGRSDHVEIRGNHIHDLTNGIHEANGIGVYGTAGATAPTSITNLTIEGNELNAMSLGRNDSLTLNGNVNGFYITNNIIHDNNNTGIGMSSFAGICSDPKYDLVQNGTIAKNVIYNSSNNANPVYPKNDNSAGGIVVDGGDNIIVDGNVLHHNDIGIRIRSAHAQHTANKIITRNNIIYLNTGSGISVGELDSRLGSIENSSIVNNIFYNNNFSKKNYGEINLQHLPATGKNNLFANNIIYTNHRGWFITNPYSSTNAKLNYNNYFATLIVKLHWQWLNQVYSIMQAYVSHSGNDAESFFSNPLFYDIQNMSRPNFYLRNDSPVLNSGLTLDESIVGKEDISGHPRIVSKRIDIGPYELG